MHLNTIVAITDFSAAAEHALDRAALVAASHRAWLRILYGADTPNAGLADPYAR
ncbi:UspA domain-containing protein, partial [Acidovorax delafieldii 2AN]